MEGSYKFRATSSTDLLTIQLYLNIYLFGFIKQLFKVSKEKTDVHEDGSDSSPKKAAKRTSASVVVESESEKDESPVKMKKKEDSSTTLPSLFEDKKFFISANIPDQQKLKRYIKA